jgi:hypothetical protein
MPDLHELVKGAYGTAAKALIAVDSVKFGAALPFPHTVMDGFLDPALCRELRMMFPPDIWQGWHKHRHEHVKSKRSSCDLLRMPFSLSWILSVLNTPDLLTLIKNATGFLQLLPDPLLEGGGLHKIGFGGFLHVHCDFNLHPVTKHQRVLNLLVYLDDADGEDGALELWDEKQCVTKINIEAGRAVLFETSDKSWHGHPSPLVGPQRRSLACYYYRPTDNPPAFHSTVYRND